MGKTKNLDKKSEDDETYQRLTEREKLIKLSEIKAREMIEVILSKRSDDGELPKKNLVDTQIDNLVGRLLRLSKDKGMDIKQLMSLINSKNNE